MDLDDMPPPPPPASGRMMAPGRLDGPTSSSLPTLLPVRRPGPPLSSASDDADAGVRATNDDAQVSKLSAVNRGYFEDPFVELFVRRPQRRSPLINRGYWARYAAMRRVILAFLRHYAPAEQEEGGARYPPAAAAAEAGPPQPPPPLQPSSSSSSPFEPTCQVVVLGAGYDTTWLQLCREHDAHVAAAAAAAAAAGRSTAATTTRVSAARGPPFQSPPPPPDPGAGGGVRPGRDVADPRTRVRWVDVDFPEVVASKARVLLSGGGGVGGGGGFGARRQPQPPHQPPSLLFPPPPHATASAASSAAGAAAEQAAALVRAQLPPPPPPPPPPEEDPSPSLARARPPRPPAEILGRAYSLVGCDLRSLEAGLGPALVRAGAAVAASAAAAEGAGAGWEGAVSLRLPTLFVAECVLAYMEPGEARALLEYLGRCAAAGGGVGGEGGAGAGGAGAGGSGGSNTDGNSISSRPGPCPGVPAAVLAYDVASPDDPFGRQMRANLAARGCPMRGAAAAPDVAAQAARLRAALAVPPAAPDAAAAVSVEADALDMAEVWSRTLAVDLEAGGGGGAEAAATAVAVASQPPPPFSRPLPPSPPQAGERRRAERLEPLDEMEEWDLFGRHYCVALGVREPRGGGAGGGAPPPLWPALRAALRPAPLAPPHA